MVQERDVLLGPDSAVAAEYVRRVRSQLVSQYRAAFSSMVQTEQFGLHSCLAAGGVGRVGRVRQRLHGQSLEALSS